MNASVRVEQIDKELVVDMERKIEVNNLVLKHVEYSGNAIQWVCCSCDEGIIYIVSEGHADVAIFMSEFEIEPDEVKYVGFWTKGLKKIKPLSYRGG